MLTRPHSILVNKEAGLVEVRELQEADVRPAYATHVSDLMTELAREKRVLAEDDLRAVTRLNHLFVALDGDRIVGLVCLVPMRLPQGVRLWIESVIVDPRRRRHRVGRRLMEAAMAKAETYGDVPVSLTSNPTRSEAHRLFDQMGFQRAQTAVFRRSAGSGA